MDPGLPEGEAIGFRDGRIAAVGSRDAVLRKMGPEAEVDDLGGGAVLPGFIDAHHHLCLAAFDRRAPSLDLGPRGSIDEVLGRVERLAATTPGSGWLRAQGYDPAKLREGRPPRVEELDEVCPERPLLLIAYSFHEGVLNRRGLREMGWDRTSADPVNGHLVRGRGGDLTGEVAEDAFYLAEARSRAVEGETAADAWISACEDHCRELLRHGIVRIGDAAVPPAFDALYQRALRDGRLPIAVHRMPVAAESLLHPRFDDSPTGSGPGGSPVGPAKLFLDGAERCAVCFSLRQLVEVAARFPATALTRGIGPARRAATRTGLPHRGEGRRLERGLRFWSEEALDATVDRAAERDFQVALHAVGNHAVELACRSLNRREGVLRDRPGRPRIEHAVFIDEPLARRIADCGAIAVVQPYWIHELGDDFQATPMPRAWRVLGLRTMLDADVAIAGSSDYPVAGFDVLAAVRAAVTRQTMGGRSLQAAEALDVDEALGAYTLGAARALGVESQAGTLEPGKRADMVVLSADPRRVAAERLADLRVERTYVAGTAVHEAEPAPGPSSSPAA